MVGYGSTALPTRAGPAEHRNILINGNICEIVSVKCDPELANYIENAECSGSGKVSASFFEPGSQILLTLDILPGVRCSHVCRDLRGLARAAHDILLRR